MARKMARNTVRSATLCAQEHSVLRLGSMYVVVQCTTPAQQHTTFKHNTIPQPKLPANWTSTAWHVAHVMPTPRISIST